MGGAARRGQLVESSGYAFNDKGKLCIQGYRDLGFKYGALSTGPAVKNKIQAAKALNEHHTYISVSLLYATGVRQSHGRMVTLYLSTFAVIHSYRDWQDNSCVGRRG